MKEQIARYISSTFLHGERTVAYDEPLFESGIVDSLGFITLLSYLEKTFRVRIGMSEITMEKFNTIDSMASIVAGKQAAAAQG